MRKEKKRNSWGNRGGGERPKIKSTTVSNMVCKGGKTKPKPIANNNNTQSGNGEESKSGRVGEREREETEDLGGETETAKYKQWMNKLMGFTGRRRVM